MALHGEEGRDQRYTRVRGVAEHFDVARVALKCWFVHFRFGAGIIRVALRESLHLSVVGIFLQSSRWSSSARSVRVSARELSVHLHR